MGFQLKREGHLHRPGGREDSLSRQPSHGVGGASGPKSCIAGAQWQLGLWHHGPRSRRGADGRVLTGSLSNPQRRPAGEQTYLESTDDQERTDAVGSHLRRDVLQVLPREGAGEVQGGELRQGPLCAPPSEAKRHDTQGQEAPRATWLGDSMAGEPPTVGTARSQVSKEGLFKRKWKETLQLPHSWTSENPTSWVIDMVNHGNYQTFTAVIVWMEMASFQVTYRRHTPRLE